MVTWLPMIHAVASAQSLTDEDLAKQVVDSDAILGVLNGSTRSEIGLPGRMWYGFEWRLCIHGLTCAYVLVNERGGDSPPTQALLDTGSYLEEIEQIGDPPWIGDLDVHRSHRSQLIMMHPPYAERWPNNPERMPVLYPQLTEDDPRGYRLRLAERSVAALSTGERVLPDWLRYDKHKREVVTS